MGLMNDAARARCGWRALLPLLSVALVGAGVACSDDDDLAAADGGAVDVVDTPPLPDWRDAAEPPDGFDTTGMLATPELVTDVGEPTDGPSWHALEQALYFTVPRSTTSTLRRLLPDGVVEPVHYDDGGRGKPGPFGTATGGGSTLFVTEPSAIARIDFDGGEATVTRRGGPLSADGGLIELGLLGDIVAVSPADASARAYFVDTRGTNVFRYDPLLGADELAVVATGPGVGGATAIARFDRHGDRGLLVAFTGISAIAVFREQSDGSFTDTGDPIPMAATPPNGIAVDDEGYLYIAWARGIDVISPASQRMGSSPGLPIGAVPTSLTFGGADRKTLFVTTNAGKVYAVPARNAGGLR